MNDMNETIYTYTIIARRVKDSVIVRKWGEDYFSHRDELAWMDLARAFALHHSREQEIVLLRKEITPDGDTACEFDEIFLMRGQSDVNTSKS